MKKYNFSLVELLTVVVIASILMSIAVPAFSRMMRGSATTQAGRELMGRIHAARSLAVAQQSPVAIVFYGCEVPDSGDTLSIDYAFSAYRVCKVKYDDVNQSWIFQSWASEWYFLPKGIAIGLPPTMTNALPTTPFTAQNGEDKENDSALIRIAEPGSTDSSAPEFFKVANDPGNSPVYFCDTTDIYPDSAGTTVDFRNAIVFNSNGTMEKAKNLSLDDNESTLVPNSPVIIPMREAVVDSGSVTFECEPEEYVPVRLDPSGKTYFYDGFVEY